MQGEVLLEQSAENAVYVGIDVHLHPAAERLTCLPASSPHMRP
jgi:hypothetical protein